MRDLNFLEVQRAFVRFVEDFHEQHGHCSDFQHLARVLNVAVRVGRAGRPSYAALLEDGTPVVVLEPGQAARRAAFTAWHELSHVLFRLAWNGDLNAYLLEFANGEPELARQLEEDICYHTAGVLLMPRPVLEGALTEHGPTPRAALALVGRTGASLEAATRRVVQALGLDVITILSGHDGRVLDSYAHGPRLGTYRVRKQSVIDARHPSRALVGAPDTVQAFDTYIPYANGNRSHHADVLATCDARTRRTLAFYFRRGCAPGPRSHLQPRLL